MARDYTIPPRLLADPSDPLHAVRLGYLSTLAPIAHAASHRASGSDPLIDVISAKSANYTLVNTDSVVVFNTTTAGLTATLPSASTAGAGKKYLIKKLGGTTANPLTIASSGGTIDTFSTEVISIAGGFREVISDGTNWHIVGGKVEPVVVSLANVAAAGTISIDASIGNIYRVTTTGSTATLAVPTNAIDADSINIEVTANAALSLTINASILLTTGITTPISVPINKKLFLGLRTIGTTWYLLASTQQS